MSEKKKKRKKERKVVPQKSEVFCVLGIDMYVEDRISEGFGKKEKKIINTK